MRKKLNRMLLISNFCKENNIIIHHLDKRYFTISIIDLDKIREFYQKLSQSYLISLSNFPEKLFKYKTKLYINGKYKRFNRKLKRNLRI